MLTQRSYQEVLAIGRMLQRNSDTQGYDVSQISMSKGHHFAINYTRYCFQPLRATPCRMQREAAVFS